MCVCMLSSVFTMFHRLLDHRYIFLIVVLLVLFPLWWLAATQRTHSHIQAVLYISKDCSFINVFIFSGFAVVCGWTSNGRCRFTVVTFTMASISSLSLLFSSFTWAASPTPSLLEDYWEMLLTITRFSKDICMDYPKTANEHSNALRDIHTCAPCVSLRESWRVSSALL